MLEILNFLQLAVKYVDVLVVILKIKKILRTVKHLEDRDLVVDLKEENKKNQEKDHHLLIQDSILTQQL